MTPAPASIIPEYAHASARVSRFRGALIQTGAIFVDAYRELNHRKMFWIVLVLSGIVVVSFAGVGIDDSGLWLFGMSLPLPFNTAIMPRGDFYKLMFNTLGVDIWLSWFATILAIISTAGIFPDMLTGGSVDLYLSKPLSRLRLFLTKYAGALLFVTLQVSIFTVACFFVLGVRGKVWLWGLFLAIPIMVCFFSYLYCICVLVGMITRSTLAALLITLLLWFGIYIIGKTEASLLFFQERSQQEALMYDRQISALEKTVARLELPPVTQPTTRSSANESPQPDKNDGFFAAWLKSIAVHEEKTLGPQAALAKAQQELADVKKKRAEFSNPFIYWHRMAMICKSVLPKTTETIELLNRGLAKYADISSANDDDDQAPPPPVTTGSHQGRHFGRSPEQEAIDTRATREMVNVVMHRSIGWVVGTSLGFEAVMLGLAALIFVRRDF